MAYCWKCGEELREGSEFCASCGSPAYKEKSVPGSAPRPARPGTSAHEKEEKGQEKQEEKGQGLDEKYHRNPLGFVTFAVTVIWLGIFLVLQNQDVFAKTDRGWAIFVWGLAVLAVIEVGLRLTVPRWRQPVVGKVIWAAIWGGVGAGLWSRGNWEIIGPIVLIAIGVAMVMGRVWPRR